MNGVKLVISDAQEGIKAAKAQWRVVAEMRGNLPKRAALVE